MWEEDLARFQTLLLGHEFFGGKDEPYWLYVGGENIFGRIIRYKDVLGFRGNFPILRFGLDMLEKCAGRSESLFCIRLFPRKRWNWADLSFVQLIKRLGSDHFRQCGRFWSHVCKTKIV